MVRFTSGICEMSDRDVPAVVELDEEEAGDPERQEVHRHADHDLVGAEVDREEGVHEREQPAGRASRSRGRRPRVPVLSAPQIPKKAPISIIPSRPMFTTPERSEKIPPIAAKVSGVANTSIEAISARSEDLVEVARARARREVAEAEPDHAGGDRAPAEPARRRGSQRRPRTATASSPSDDRPR